MELVPLRTDYGVEIRGLTLVDVAASDEAYQTVRAAFEEHSVLLFRDQNISDDVQAAFSRAFKREVGVAPGAWRRGERGAPEEASSLAHHGYRSNQDHRPPFRRPAAPGLRRPTSRPRRS